MQKYFRVLMKKTAVLVLFLLGAFAIFRISFSIQPDITIIGPVKYADGLGRNTIDFASILSKEFNISIIPTQLDKQDLPEWVNKCLKKNTKGLGKLVLYIKPVWELKNKDLKLLRQIKSKYKSKLIAYSMFESSLIPESGVQVLNEFFDVVVVPDPYLVSAYKSSGVYRPIEVLPLAVDFSELKKFPLKTKKNKVFTFTALSSSIYRKNILGIVEAFSDKFKNRQDVRLVINSRYSFNGNHHEILRYLHRHDIRNVIFTTRSLKNFEYNNLFASSDCFVSAAFGEGFSIQPREAMVLGIPSIVTNNTAQQTICSSGLVKSVECHMTEPAYHYFSDKPYGLFFKCSREDLSEAMEDVYLNYDKYLERNLEARSWALNFDISNLENTYLLFFKKMK